MFVSFIVELGFAAESFTSIPKTPQSVFSAFQHDLDSAVSIGPSVCKREEKLGGGRFLTPLK